VTPNDCQNIVEKVPVAGALKPFLTSGFREGLTRETCTQNVVGGDVIRLAKPYIPSGYYAKVVPVQVAQLGVLFASEDTGVAKL